MTIFWRIRQLWIKFLSLPGADTDAAFVLPPSFAFFPETIDFFLLL